MVQQLTPCPHASSVLNPVKSSITGKVATATSGSGTGSSGTSATSAGDISSTFLNLLVQELQNQDPTAPMDSTAMVGQMISLNQLDQLVSINQEIGTPANTVKHVSTSIGGDPSMQSVSNGSYAVTPSTISLPLSPNTASAQPFLPS